ncbi:MULTISPECIES: SDR family oxidoreductase [unclassified Nocardioides]|uniref:SDR family oxidoreductase n=1 Tax=unclassified Nocardioides TaxID=2615069 RepID=UPI0006F47260|nr:MULTISPECIES: SDR family oxidoreductase [unclassified Nocardioides]KQY57372.1 short-chain dehydrogenase [Nocardioides sp. Root140]KQZ68885.1 short-chain dehydrogenase [Nocardioides sp. Root151]KRF20438.1 short-chain dehydrogenase [Nocardioides sp. Soil796]
MTIALVTGASRGLGLATVRTLAKNGTCVLLAARDAGRAEEEARSLRSEGLDVRGIQLDVTSHDSIASAVATMTAVHGRLDVLVNNAGILPEATDDEAHEFANPELFLTTFTTNVFGAVAVTEAFLPLLRRSPMGRIVNVSSTMGSLSDQTDPGSPFYEVVVPAYQASKAALNSVTIALAKRLAETPIKVTSVCPGFVQTDLTPANMEQAPLTPAEASLVVAHAATLPDNAESGTFIDHHGAVAW